MNIDEPAPYLLCVRLLRFFLIYLISFIFHFLTFGEMEILLRGNLSFFFVKKNPSDHEWEYERNFCVQYRACGNVRNQRIGSGEARKKDIKLKVVKTSSRFSIYFELHFAFLLGVFHKCVFVSAKIESKFTQKKPKVCKCGLLSSHPTKENPIKLFIAFRFVRFVLITILTFQLFFSSSSNFLTSTLSEGIKWGRGMKKMCDDGKKREKFVFIGFVNVWLRFSVVKLKNLSK